MDYVIPDVPLEVQQRILEELILARDPEATFVAPAVAPTELEGPSTLGQ